MFNNNRIATFVKRYVQNLRMKSNSSTVDLINNKTSITSCSTPASVSTPSIYLIEEHVKSFPPLKEENKTEIRNA